MSVGRPFASVTKISLLKTFLVVLVKTGCMMASKVVAIGIKGGSHMDKTMFSTCETNKTQLPSCFLLLNTYVYPFMYI